MTTSSWDLTKPRSKYHFDNFKIDPEQDRVIRLGHIIADWSSELKKIIDTAQPATWRTRGVVGKARPEEELAAEEYDLERNGYGKDYVITHLNWEIPEVLLNISNLFGLEDCMNRIHVQRPGEVWNLHLDKLEKWCPHNPDSVIRLQLQLTDWEPGHFWSYGNYLHQGWRAGDLTTFDWINIPHSTANAGFNPRVTFQMTGVMTEKTRAFLQHLSEINSFVI
jgi:hypothetical protein